MSHNRTSLNTHYQGGMVTAGAAVSLTDAGTYYKIEDTWTVFADPKGFTVDAGNDRLVYSGATGAFLFSGSSDLSVDKNCKITYGLHKNGVLVPGAETPHDFGSANSTSNISITAILTLEADDYLEVWAKSDIATTALTVASLAITAWGSK